MLAPLNDKIVVRRDSAESTTKSGIIIPETVQKNSQFGIVLAVGPGRPTDRVNLDDGESFLRRAVTLRIEDHIVFGAFAGITVKIDGEELLIMSEDDVLAVIR